MVPVCNGTSSTGDNVDDDCSVDGEVEFTPVLSRKAKRNARKNSGMKKKDLGVPLGGAGSRGGGTKHHPLCDVVVGPRTRSKTKR